MLALSLEDTARDFLRTQRVQSLATVGPRACAEVDAVAATLGFAESSENGVVNAWSSNVGKLTSPSLPLLRPRRRRLRRSITPASSPTDSYSCSQVWTSCPQTRSAARASIHSSLICACFSTYLMPDDRCVRGRCSNGE